MKAYSLEHFLHSNVESWPIQIAYGFNMESTYQGIYTYKNAQGKIEAVQVEDSIGKGSTIPIEEYIQRGIEPSAELLPDKSSYLH